MDLIPWAKTVEAKTVDNDKPSATIVTSTGLSQIPHAKIIDEQIMSEISEKINKALKNRKYGSCTAEYLFNTPNINHTNSTSFWTEKDMVTKILKEKGYDFTVKKDYDYHGNSRELGLVFWPK